MQRLHFTTKPRWRPGEAINGANGTKKNDFHRVAKG
jgi:hypothetical protein